MRARSIHYSSTLCACMSVRGRLDKARRAGPLRQCQTATMCCLCAGEKVAIKKITNVFEHVSDATRIVREIKLLRLLKHPGMQRLARTGTQPLCRLLLRLPRELLCLSGY